MCLITAGAVSAGCATNEPTEPCDDRPVVPGGSAELGLGFEFTPVADQEQVELQLGTQGLWMFIVNARAYDMELGTGEGVEIDAVDASGTVISLEAACRTREFDDQGNGTLQLSSAFLLPLLPDATPTLDGSTITIRLEIRDTKGRRATDERTIVAKLPNR
ncbi:MAG: hypothetical protein H7138_12200 [Myxococcales bacterium]|nr:hypothetical protein [Myxococcales bacterium]